MIKLFEIGDNNMATLNKPWISLIPEFHKLLARDKGGPNDGSGRYKKKATREFTMMFFWLDFHSPFEEEPEDQRLEHSLQAAGITMDKWESDYLKDEDFMVAMDKYTDMLNNSATSLQTLRDMRKAKHAMNSHLRTINFSQETNGGALKYDIRKVQDAIMRMPKLEEAIDEMEKTVRAQINNVVSIRGDAEKGYEEDPEDDEENY